MHPHQRASHNAAGISTNRHKHQATKAIDTINQMMASGSHGGDEVTARAAASLKVLEQHDDSNGGAQSGSGGKSVKKHKKNKSHKKFRVKAASSTHHSNAHTPLSGGGSATPGGVAIPNPAVPKAAGGGGSTLPQLVPKPPVRVPLHEAMPQHRKGQNHVEKLLLPDHVDIDEDQTVLGRSNNSSSQKKNQFTTKSAGITGGTVGVTSSSSGGSALHRQLTSDAMGAPSANPSFDAAMVAHPSFSDLREQQFPPNLQNTTSLVTSASTSQYNAMSSTFGSVNKQSTAIDAFVGRAPGASGNELSRVASPPQAPLPKMPVFASLEGARIRKQIFSLCKQLFKGSTNMMEVTVKEQGNVVWRSTNSEPDLPEVDVDVFDEDIAEVRQRATRAFDKTAKNFNAKIQEQAKEIAALTAELKAKEPGGEKYQALQDELHQCQAEVRRQQTKIKSLVKLLDRAGAQIKYHEENQDRDRRANKEDAMDWLTVKAVVKDLITEERADGAILRDVVEHIEHQNTKIGDLEATNDTITERFAESDAMADLVKRENKQVRKELDDAKSTLGKTIEQLNAAQADHSELQYRMKQLEIDNEHETLRLMQTITNLEKSVRKNVEAKPYFVGQGKSANVLPFLRFEGRVKNLDMPKKVVENIINAIWCTRYNTTTVSAKEAAVLTSGNPSPRGGGTRGKQENPLDKVYAVKSLEKAFVQAVADYVQQQEDSFGKGGDGGSSGDISSEASILMESTTGAFNAEQMQSLLESGAAASTMDITLIDYDNLSLWNRQDRFNFSFHDHVLRFLMENYCPEKCSSILVGYKAGEGISSAHANAVSGGAGGASSQLLKPGTTIPQLVAEIAYSLVEGCEKFKFDADVEMFRRVLRQEIPESAFFDQMIMVQKLKFALQKSGQMETREQDAKPTVYSVLKQLNVFFPSKPAENMMHIKRCLCQDLDVPDTCITAASTAAVISAAHDETVRAALEKTVKIGKLFESNEHGNQGMFVESMRDQHLEELCIHMSEVTYTISSARGPPGQPAGTATVADIRKKLIELDQSKPIEDVNKYLYELLRLARFTGGAVTPSSSPGAGEELSLHEVNDPSSSHVVHLNTIVDCASLANQCKFVVYKRYTPNLDPAAQSQSIAESRRSSHAATPSAPTPVAVDAHEW